MGRVLDVGLCLRSPEAGGLASLARGILITLILKRDHGLDVTTTCRRRALTDKVDLRVRVPCCVAIWKLPQRIDSLPSKYGLLARLLLFCRLLAISGQRDRLDYLAEYICL